MKEFCDQFVKLMFCDDDISCNTLTKKNLYFTVIERKNLPDMYWFSYREFASLLTGIPCDRLPEDVSPILGMHLPLFMVYNYVRDNKHHWVV